MMNGIAMAVVGWIAGVASTSITLVLKSHLEACKEERRARRDSGREVRDNRVAADRATYNDRITILIRCHLATYVRSGGRWWSDDHDLQSLVLGIERGTYEHFLDPQVEACWVTLVEKTVALAKARREGSIATEDIEEYNDIRNAWETAAKLSFGPFPETSDLCRPRGSFDENNASIPAAA